MAENRDPNPLYYRTHIRIRYDTRDNTKYIMGFITASKSASILLSRPSLLVLTLIVLSHHASALQQPLQAGWAVYQSLLVTKPILTKAVTSGVIMGLSDAITQRVERKFLSTEVGDRKDTASFPQNWARTWQTFCTGLCWSGYSAHVWYASLEQIMTNFFPVTSPALGLLIRLVLDALIFSPITIGGFFIVNSLIQAGPSRTNLATVVSVIQEKLVTKWKKAVLAAWSFWPVVNVFNFSLVPLKYRVLYANVMALLWTGYLSFVNYQKKQQVT